MRTILKFQFILSLIFCFAIVGCQEEKYEEELDLFQPRFVLEEPAVEGNSFAIVWYEVNDAVSYTVELYLDNYYTEHYATFEQTSTNFYIDNIPYGTRYYVRVRSNAPKAINNSHWAYTSATTETRPAYDHILNDVQRIDIEDYAVTIKWDVSDENPVDSISVLPIVNTAAAPINRYLTDAEKQSGEAYIDNLSQKTLYSVTLFDTAKPGTYDKPYNQVRFTTTGPAAGSVMVNQGDDLSAILNAANINPDVPEGVEYILENGATFSLAPFAITKGFLLTSPSGGERADVTMIAGTSGSWWNFAANAYVEKMEFSNINFSHEEGNTSGYFMNAENSYEAEQIVFFNCDFSGFGRGFWRHKNNNYKRIGSFEMDYCVIKNCGAFNASGGYGTFNMGSDTDDMAYDNIESASFTNMTFMNAVNGSMGNLFYAPKTTYPVNLTYKNVTIYNYFDSSASLVQFSWATGSTLTFENVLFASRGGAFFVEPSGLTKNFSNNYVTTEASSAGYSLVNAVNLEVSATDLFADPANGNLTIKMLTSPIVANEVGDPRWLP